MSSSETMTMSDEQHDLGGKAIRGASLTMVGQGVRIVVLLASTIVLSRILTPRDFGLLAIVASIVALGELVRDFGLSTAAARAPFITQGQKSNLFWINTGVGLVLAAITFLTAPFVADFFGQPELRQIVMVLSPVFLLSGISTQFRVEINRRLDFRALTTADTLPVFLGLVGALAYAIVDQSYWVLVVQQLVTAVSGLLLAIILAKWTPGLPSRKASIREFLRYGAGLFGTQAIAYVTKNIDNITLGYFWGPTPLGIYTRAYQLLMLPINQIAAPLTRVAVPILTRVAPDAARFLRYLTAGQLIGGVLLGLLYGVSFGMARPLVEIIFGDGWLAMIPVFQALALGGVFRALNQITFWIFLAKDRTGAQFRFYLVSQPLIIIAILCGLPWGPVGVAIGHSIGYFTNWLISMWWCGKATDTPTRALLWSGIRSILTFVVPVGAIGLLVTAWIPGTWESLLLGLLGIALYLGLAYLISKYVREVGMTLFRGAKHLRRKK